MATNFWHAIMAFIVCITCTGPCDAFRIALLAQHGNRTGLTMRHGQREDYVLIQDVGLVQRTQCRDGPISCSRIDWIRCRVVPPWLQPEPKESGTFSMHETPKYLLQLLGKARPESLYANS